MHKRAFHGLKRTFMHVSVLPQFYFEKKNPLVYKNNCLTKMVEKDMRLADTSVAGPERQCFSSFPTINRHRHILGNIL